MAMDSEVRKSLLDRTDAEKAFRPWWDTLEDTLLNTLIALGNTLVVLLYLYLSLQLSLAQWPKYLKKCEILNNN